jgi:hypothetical protein
MIHGAVFGVADDARLHRNTQHIAGDHRHIGAILTVFFHFAVTADNPDGEGNFGGTEARPERVQPDITHQVGFRNRELDITVARQLLLRDCARVRTAVATAGLLQGGAVDRGIGEIGPDDILRLRPGLHGAGAKQ